MIGDGQTLPGRLAQTMGTFLGYGRRARPKVQEKSIAVVVRRVRRAKAPGRPAATEDAYRRPAPKNRRASLARHVSL